MADKLDMYCDICREVQEFKFHKKSKDEGADSLELGGDEWNIWECKKCGYRTFSTVEGPS